MKEANAFSTHTALKRSVREVVCLFRVFGQESRDVLTSLKKSLQLLDRPHIDTECITNSFVSLYNRISEVYGLARIPKRQTLHNTQLCFIKWDSLFRYGNATHHIAKVTVVSIDRLHGYVLLPNAIDTRQCDIATQNKSVSMASRGRILSRKNGREVINHLCAALSLNKISPTLFYGEQKLFSTNCDHQHDGNKKGATADSDDGKDVPSTQSEATVHEGNSLDCSDAKACRDSDRNSDCSRQEDEMDGYSSSSNSSSCTSGDNSSSSSSSSNTSNSSDSSQSIRRRKKSSKSSSASSNDRQDNDTTQIGSVKRLGIEVTSTRSPTIVQEVTHVDVDADTLSESSGDADDEFESDCEEMYPLLPPAPVDQLVLPWKQYKRQQLDNLLTQNRNDMIEAIVRRRESQVCNVSPKSTSKKDLVPANNEGGSISQSRHEAVYDSSTWIMECSCGFGGVGVDDGKLLVECEKCKHWVHMKCAKQRLGFEGDNELPEPFYCFECEWIVDCSCGVHCMNYDDYQRMIQCDKCSSWQHTFCAGILDTEEPPSSYNCSKCVSLESEDLSSASTPVTRTKSPADENGVAGKQHDNVNITPQGKGRQTHNKHRNASMLPLSSNHRNDDSRQNEPNSSTKTTSVGNTGTSCPMPSDSNKRMRADAKVNATAQRRANGSKAAKANSELEEHASRSNTLQSATKCTSEGVQKRSKSGTTRPVHLKRRGSVHARLEQKLKQRRKKT